MSLFDVPGWQVPTQAVSAASVKAKKRKKSKRKGDEKNQNLADASKNLESIVKMMDESPDRESSSLKSGQKRKRGHVQIYLPNKLSSI